MIFTNFVLNAFQYHSQVDFIYIYIWILKSILIELITILIKILKDYEFGIPPISWFKSHFKNRYQWFKVFGTKSTVFHASSRVPQGGHLSPLLFSLFVGGAFSNLEFNRLLCFADDMKLFMSIESLKNCVKLQSDFNRFVDWSKSIGLELNICKCSIMTFSKRHSQIKFCYNVNGTSLE